MRVQHDRWERCIMSCKHPFENLWHKKLGSAVRSSAQFSSASPRPRAGAGRGGGGRGAGQGPTSGVECPQVHRRVDANNDHQRDQEANGDHDLPRRDQREGQNRVGLGHRRAVSNPSSAAHCRGQLPRQAPATHGHQAGAPPLPRKGRDSGIRRVAAHATDLAAGSPGRPGIG